MSCTRSGLPLRSLCSRTSMGTAAYRRGASLSACHAHVPRHGGAARAAVDDEVVALGLARDGFVDGTHQRVVVGAGAQRRAQIGGVVLAETHVERAGAREPHAVAALAEIVRHRGDEAEAAARLLDTDIARRAAG